jgi:uncharacterized Zn-binding protein involved in type VI secretion
VPPPGAGFATITASDPAVTTTEAGTVAESVPSEFKVVTRTELPTVICDAATKPVPVTVKVKSAEPTVTVDGENVVITGVGLATVSVAAPLVPPPGVGFETVTASGPTVATIEAGTFAESVPSELSVVGKDSLAMLICDAATKPGPVTVSVKSGEPTVTVDGESVTIDGIG